MNSLTKPLFYKRAWGSEIIWTLTDHYMAKTIEIDPGKVNELIVYEKKEKSIIIVENTLILATGSCCDEKDLEYFELPIGYSKYIAPGEMHRYGATDKFVRIIEISSPELDEAIVIGNLGEEINYDAR
ncbi:MAG: cupin domain-containing protein [Candidatus Hodarchaeales archaeon]|jgi:hypothetical protein